MFDHLRTNRLVGRAVAIALATMLAPIAQVAHAEPLDTLSARHAHARRGPAVITITARDFAFDAPDSIPAGVTTINLVNRGPDMHHLQLIKLAPGKTVADIQKLMQQGDGPPPAWLTLAGGPNAVAPGHQATATIDLTPGSYALLCFIPGPDGQPHVMKGMMRQLTVTAARSSASPLPKADLTLTLKDYGFGSTKSVTPGRHTITVVNAAQQPHEVAVFKLAPGRSAKDITEWIEKRQGPPPATPIGGIAGLAPGTTQQFAADFEPGEYAYICFAGDAKDGKPHFAHGMMTQFTVGRGSAAAK